MKLRCKDGDLALVVNEDPGCEENIGRVVEVRGPVLFSQHYSLNTWLIKPVHPAPWAVARGDDIVPERVTWRMQIELPDRWLIPLRPSEDDKDQSTDSLVPEPEMSNLGV